MLLMIMQPNVSSKAGRIVICLLVLSLFFLVLPVVNTALAAESGGPNSGLPDYLMLSWTEDPLTTQTISWRTGTDTSQNLVQFMPAAGFNGSFDGAQEITGEKKDLYEGHYRFEATLRGLLPDTKYVYRVGGGDAWSDSAIFTTAAADEHLSFLYMGDVQEGHESWGELLEGAATGNPELKFALLGGDLVDHGNSVAEWQDFFAASWPVFKELPLMPAVGNHDDTELFRNSFALPGNGPQGYGNTIYSFDYGNCHITVLNSNCMGIPGIGDYERIAGWLQNDLTGSSQRWKFLVFHHPPYPVVYDWRADVLQEHWVPLFEQCGVDMVFVGHQHVYMRTRPLYGGEIRPDGKGIVYLMGNAGTKYYGPGPAYEYIAEQIAWVSNYQVIDIDGNILTMTSRDAAGNIIDSYRLEKNIPVTGIIIPEGDQELEMGDTFQLTAKVLPADASDQGVAWESSDETIAAISESGLVTAVAEGEAIITAISGDGYFSASVKVTVVPAVLDTYSVTFILTDGENVVEGAVIEVKDSEGEVVAPVADGTYYRLAAGDYSYTVIIEGYKDVTGTFTVANEDITVKVILEKADGKEELHEAIGKAVALEQGDYTPGNWQAFQSTLRIARVILNLEQATQAAEGQATARLTAAMKQLVEKPDKTALEAAINEARSLNPEVYTPRSWRRLKNALSFTIPVYENENASRIAVDTVLFGLNGALDGLEER